MEMYGYAVKTTDGVVGTSGRSLTCGGLFITDDGSASTVKFYDGTSASGTLVFQVTTTAGVPSNFAFPDGGIVFKNGMFVDVDAHTVQATVAFRHIG